MSVEKVGRKGGEVVWRVRWRDHTRAEPLEGLGAEG